MRVRCTRYMMTAGASDHLMIVNALPREKSGLRVRTRVVKLDGSVASDVTRDKFCAPAGGDGSGGD